MRGFSFLENTYIFVNKELTCGIALEEGEENVISWHCGVLIVGKSEVN